MFSSGPSFEILNDRSRAIFGVLVEEWIRTGEPVGSRAVSKSPKLNLSPATVRNVLQDLMEYGLLRSPHVSAGRIPTQAGLRLFIDALLNMGPLQTDEHRVLAEAKQALSSSVRDGDIQGTLERLSSKLAGLTRTAALVLAPKMEACVRQVEFVPLTANRFLVVLVYEDGAVENRIVYTSQHFSPAAFEQINNFLKFSFLGTSQTLQEAIRDIQKEIVEQRAHLNETTQALIEKGLGTFISDTPRTSEDLFIVKGSSHLLAEEAVRKDLETVRKILANLENKRSLLHLLEATHSAQGLSIFIGTENEFFDHEGWSAIVTPFGDSGGRILGIIGVIGPSNMNYSRIVPLVDYSARITQKEWERLLAPS